MYLISSKLVYTCGIGKWEEMWKWKLSGDVWWGWKNVGAIEEAIDKLEKVMNFGLRVAHICITFKCEIWNKRHTGRNIEGCRVNEMDTYKMRRLGRSQWTLAMVKGIEWRHNELCSRHDRLACFLTGAYLMQCKCNWKYVKICSGLLGREMETRKTAFLKTAKVWHSVSFRVVRVRSQVRRKGNRSQVRRKGNGTIY